MSPGTFIWRKIKESESNEDDEGDSILVNECLLKNEEVHEVYSVKVPQSQHNLPHVIKAKEKEHATLKEFNTYSEIREDQLTDEQKNNVIGSIWVIVNKELLGETVCKARICC